MAIDGVSIGTTSTIIVDANPYRRKIVFVNNSDEDIYLAPGGAAISTYGIALKASGGSVTDEPDHGGYIYKGPWFGICASGGKILSVTELSSGR